MYYINFTDVIPIVPDEKVKDEASSGDKKNSTVVDLTLSDSDDDQPLKRKTPPKPDSSTNALNGMLEQYLI